MWVSARRKIKDKNRLEASKQGLGKGERRGRTGTGTRLENWPRGMSRELNGGAKYWCSLDTLNNENFCQKREKFAQKRVETQGSSGGNSGGENSGDLERLGWLGGPGRTGGEDKALLPSVRLGSGTRVYWGCVQDRGGKREWGFIASRSGNRT